MENQRVIALHPHYAALAEAINQVGVSAEEFYCSECGEYHERGLHDADDHGPGCDGPLNCTCNPYPDIDAALTGRDCG